MDRKKTEMEKKDEVYEAFKVELFKKELTSAEYEKAIRKWCEENNY